MKISCLPVSLFKEIIDGDISLKQWANDAKSVGLDGIDVSMAFFKNHTPTYISTVKDDIAKAGIPIIMATTYPDFTHPDAMQREREMEYLRRDIALCSELDVAYLRVLAGQAHPSMDIEQGTSLAIEGLKKSAKVASKYGVKLLYEDHAKPGAWHYIDFSFPPDIFLNVYRGIQHTDIGINFDTGNIVAYGDHPLPVLKQVIDDVETIHVSDMKRFGEFSPTLIGTGVVPLKEIFSYLK
ncbi:MAG: sugar phosphate isomerase/epimerase, partial [Clostridia bacterium]|nr:sugar phosphate isomerase/epimerase [Clostridia bacterium]